ncbi:MAG: hypothetical protein LBL49_09470 [Clostridiales Family XIII bacterium]|nr:hypothetical protein [Clostridiales Family XIII bacterium]
MTNYIFLSRDNGTLQFFYRNEGNEQLGGEIVALVSSDYGNTWEASDLPYPAEISRV